MLVSAVMPIMSIYRLPLGQYGLHWAHHQLTTGCSHICTFTLKTTIWGGRLDRTKGLSAVSQRLPRTQICSTRYSHIPDREQQILSSQCHRPQPGSSSTASQLLLFYHLVNHFHVPTTCQKLVSNYTRHWHPHSLRSPKWRLRHPSIICILESFTHDH